MSNAFFHKLAESVRANNSLLCIGLDPDPQRMPVEDISEFNRAIIEATSDLVCAYKPNFAFYEALGESGWRALRDTLDVIPSDIPIIADAKRGDIGNTSTAYAKSIFDLGCDAVTVNAWGGYESIEPFLNQSDKGIFIWCRSSNDSARDFQDIRAVYDGPDARYPNNPEMKLWKIMALKAQEWSQKHSNLGLCMGATYLDDLKEARKLCPEMIFLVPGVGAQGGSLEESVNAGLRESDDRDGIIINASRSIIYAGHKDFAEAARKAAETYREEIDRCRFRQPIGSSI